MPVDLHAILARITAQYEQSGDFNGLPVHALDQADPDLKPAIIALISRGDVDLVRGDVHPNPHIKAMPAEPIPKQLETIDRDGLGQGCLYPSVAHLARTGAGRGEEAPYTRALKQGAAQLSFRTFDLRVLEWYRNDPRFTFEVDDIHGKINKVDSNTAPASALVQDQVDFLEFGFAYDRDLNRGIAIFYRYLHDLPTDQQQYIAQYETGPGYALHPDFICTQIFGQWPTKISIYDAFLQEKRSINKFANVIGKPVFFRSDTKKYGRPNRFGILLRPTRKEYGDFALMLDQLLSDDINRDFFRGDMEVTEVLTKPDGSTVNMPIGTITLLERWIAGSFNADDPEEVKKITSGLRKVRSERQRPAHQVDDNIFDQGYIRQQRDLINAAFDAVRGIRMLLECHPSVTDEAREAIPPWLREGKVWDR